MSRNSSGTYSLPAGNPVVTGTPIAISWANNTLNDLASAMTDSLSRTGDGGMSVGLEGFDGTVSLPGYAFGTDLTMGLYRIAANRLGVAINATKVAEYSATALISLQPLSAPVGSAALPSYTFTGDLNTGLSAEAADTLIASTGGTARLTITSTAATFAPLLYGPAGAAGGPSYSFTLDTDTGIYNSAANTLDLVTGASTMLRINATQILANIDGTVGAPAVSFVGDPDTGIYRVSANYIGIGTAGAARILISDTFVEIANAMPLNIVAGSAAAPSLAFAIDTNTGFYRFAADEIAFSLGGTGYLVGFRNIPQNIQNLDYTCVLADSGKHIFKASGGASETFTIPANGTVAYPIGTALVFINQGGGTLTIAITTDLMTLCPGGSTGSRTLADDGIATAVKVAAAEWVISGAGLT